MASGTNYLGLCSLPGIPSPSGATGAGVALEAGVSRIPLPSKAWVAQVPLCHSGLSTAPDAYSAPPRTQPLFVRLCRQNGIEGCGPFPVCSLPCRASMDRLVMTWRFPCCRFPCSSMKCWNPNQTVMRFSHESWHVRFPSARRAHDPASSLSRRGTAGALTRPPSIKTLRQCYSASSRETQPAGTQVWPGPSPSCPRSPAALRAPGQSPEEQGGTS